MSSEASRLAKFNRLASAYGTDLYRFAMWLCGNDALAKDVVQETYLRAWKALDQLQDEAAAKGWLLTIVRREYARTFERKVPLFTDVDTNSSKFEEYRDMSSGMVFSRFRVLGESRDTNQTFDFEGFNLSRDDARYTLRYGLQLRGNRDGAGDQQKRRYDTAVPRP